MQAVLFDLDGTLLDSTRLLLEGYRHTVLSCLGVATTDEDWLPLMGLPLREQMAHFSPERADEMVRVYREFYGREHDARVAAYPHAADVLAELRQMGLALGVVTSKKTHFAWRGLRITGLADAVSAVVGEDDTVEHKPRPAPILEALRRLAVAPRQAVMVGDSPHDVAAAHAAGVAAIAALWGPFSRDALEPLHPTAYAHALAAVPDIVRSLCAHT